MEGPDGMPLTTGQVGLDVHAVAESTRITLDRQLNAFRDDEVRLHERRCAALGTLLTAESTSNVGGFAEVFRGTPHEACKTCIPLLPGTPMETVGHPRNGRQQAVEEGALARELRMAINIRVVEHATRPTICNMVIITYVPTRVFAPCEASPPPPFTHGCNAC